jgi:hypothetical protein
MMRGGWEGFILKVFDSRSRSKSTGTRSASSSSDYTVITFNTRRCSNYLRQGISIGLFFMSKYGLGLLVSSSSEDQSQYTRKIETWQLISLDIIFCVLARENWLSPKA